MTLKGFCLAPSCHGPERRTPPRGWRRASDTLTSGVNWKDYMRIAHRSQASQISKWRPM
jgi:hypothetical protein